MLSRLFRTSPLFDCSPLLFLLSVLESYSFTYSSLNARIPSCRFLPLYSFFFLFNNFCSFFICSICSTSRTTFDDLEAVSVLLISIVSGNRHADIRDRSIRGLRTKPELHRKDTLHDGSPMAVDRFGEGFRSSAPCYRRRNRPPMVPL